MAVAMRATYYHQSLVAMVLLQAHARSFSAVATNSPANNATGGLRLPAKIPKVLRLDQTSFAVEGGGPAVLVHGSGFGAAGDPGALCRITAHALSDWASGDFTCVNNSTVVFWLPSLLCSSSSPQLHASHASRWIYARTPELVGVMPPQSLCTS